jgi:hypothetical protein
MRPLLQERYGEVERKGRGVTRVDLNHVGRLGGRAAQSAASGGDPEGERRSLE